jgi:hypothetical protein
VLLLGHGGAREIFQRARVDSPAVALLGEVKTLAELNARARAVGTPGSTAELRKEEGGTVIARAMLTVSAERAPGLR